MKKYPIGFNTRIKKEQEQNSVQAMVQEKSIPRKSVVQVYFPQRDMSWAYYNDSFDLKVGDFVYVEGKLESHRGQVTEVNYSFKIKASDYKKVIAVIDTNVKGDFFLAGSHMVSFDRNTIPYSKVLPWFKAPENDAEYISGNDDSSRFPLDDLSKMKVSQVIAERGHKYYMENKVAYIEIDDTCGRAIVEGGETYEVEFEYLDGEIMNLKCSCFCSGTCKHEFATMLQLKDSLELIIKNYEDKYDDSYFALISKNVFMTMIMNRNASCKISLD